MAKTGRPKKEINIDVFENLCGIFCTQEEIADVFDCSIDTINRWCKRTYGTTFAETYKKKCANGKMSLRRWQMQSAKNGNVSMQIFLGKVYLGQKECEEAEKNAPTINISVSPASAADIEQEEQ